MTNMRYYQEFADAVEAVLLSKKHEEMKKTREPLTPKIQEDLNKYYMSAKPNQILDTLETSKVFDIDNEIKVLLLNTNPPKNAGLLKLPFKSIFIDINITNEEAELEDCDKEVKGLLVIERDVLNPEGKREGRVFNVVYRTEVTDESKEPYLYVDEAIFIIENETIRFVYKRPKTSDVIQRFLYNFILFMNQPEIERIDVHRTPEQNQKRLDKGKRPLPELTTTIHLTGKLKDYVNSLRTGRHFSLSYQFWVRGHFRTLRNECYGARAGTKIWIMPYIKGEGMLVDKSYKLMTDKMEFEPKEEEQDV